MNERQLRALRELEDYHSAGKRDLTKNDFATRNTRSRDVQKPAAPQTSKRRSAKAKAKASEKHLAKNPPKQTPHAKQRSVKDKARKIEGAASSSAPTVEDSGHEETTPPPCDVDEEGLTAERLRKKRRIENELKKLSAAQNRHN